MLKGKHLVFCRRCKAFKVLPWRPLRKYNGVYTWSTRALDSFCRRCEKRELVRRAPTGLYRVAMELFYILFLGLGYTFVYLRMALDRGPWTGDIVQILQLTFATLVLVWSRYRIEKGDYGHGGSVVWAIVNVS